MKRKYVRYVTKEKLDQVSEKNKRHIQRYFSAMSMNLSDSSKINYQSDFNQWLVFIHEKYKSGAIDEEDILKIIKGEDSEDSNDGMEDMVEIIEDYVAFCVTFLGNNERRIQRRLSTISSFFLYLLMKRKIKANPLDYIKRPKVGAGEKPQIVQTFLTEDQISTIRKYFEDNDELQLQLYFELSISTMLRVNAVNNIKISQIDFDTGMIMKIKEKEGKLANGLCSDLAMTLIDKWLKRREEMGVECEYLFTTKYNGTWGQASNNVMQTKWTKRIGSIIGVPDLHPHDFRHSGSSLMYNKGMPLEEVQELLNHNSPETTLKHYIQRDMKKLQDSKKKFEI